MTMPAEPGGGTALALQGGGAHGAFAWGALDYLLESGWRFDRVCGVSSGALTGAALVQGLNRGGAEAARADLRRLWTRIGHANALSLFQSNPFQKMFWGWDVGSAVAWQGAETALRMFNPGQLNPFGLQPLRGVVEELIEPARLARPGDVTLTISATDARSGAPRYFTAGEIGADALLASCCLPYLVPAVTIDGNDYWDGAYSGNPPLAPLLGPRPPQRLVLIAAQPRRRHLLPQSQVDIMNRVTEISSQATLDAELRALPGTVELLAIEADAALADLPLSSKVFADMETIERLFEQGRQEAAKLPAVARE